MALTPYAKAHLTLVGIDRRFNAVIKKPQYNEARTWMRPDFGHALRMADDDQRNFNLMVHGQYNYDRELRRRQGHG